MRRYVLMYHLSPREYIVKRDTFNSDVPSYRLKSSLIKQNWSTILVSKIELERICILRWHVFVMSSFLIRVFFLFCFCISLCFPVYLLLFRLNVLSWNEVTFLRVGQGCSHSHCFMKDRGNLSRNIIVSCVLRGKAWPW